MQRAPTNIRMLKRNPESGQVRTPKHLAEISSVAELAGRHSESGSELLSEVILRIESAPTGDLRYFKRTILQEAGSFFQPLLLEEMTEQAAGGAVESPRYILACVTQLACNGFDAKIFIFTKPAPDALHEGTKQPIHLRPRIRWNRNRTAVIILWASKAPEKRPGPTPLPETQQIQSNSIFVDPPQKSASLKEHDQGND